MGQAVGLDRSMTRRYPFLPPFMQSPHLQPQLVVDGPMCEQVAGEFDEYLFTSAERIRSIRKRWLHVISEIKTAATFNKFG